jgi:hypothetical protein
MAPTGLTASAASAAHVNLAWTDVSTAKTSFGAPTVQPATSYGYRVRAFNSAGSTASNTVTVTSHNP